MQTKFAPMVLSLALVCSGAQLVAAQKQLVLKPTPSLLDQAKAVPGKIQDKWNGATPVAKGVAVVITAGAGYGVYRLVASKPSRRLHREPEAKRDADISASNASSSKARVAGKDDADVKMDEDRRQTLLAKSAAKFKTDVKNSRYSDTQCAVMRACALDQEMDSLLSDARTRHQQIEANVTAQTAALREEQSTIRELAGSSNSPARSAGSSSVQAVRASFENGAKFNADSAKASATHAQSANDGNAS